MRVGTHQGIEEGMVGSRVAEATDLGMFRGMVGFKVVMSRALHDRAGFFDEVVNDAIGFSHLVRGEDIREGEVAVFPGRS